MRERRSFIGRLDFRDEVILMDGRHGLEGTRGSFGFRDEGRREVAVRGRFVHLLFGSSSMSKEEEESEEGEDEERDSSDDA